MKKSKKALSVLSLLLVMSLLVLLAACGGNTASTTTAGATAAATTAAATQAATTAAPTQAPKDPVTLRMLIGWSGQIWNNYPDNPVFQEIKKQTGVTIEYVEADQDKFKVLLAGGDLPDIVRADPVKFGKQLIDGGLIVPLDDLVKSNGGDISANVPDMVNYSIKNWSENTGKLYFLSPEISKPAPNPTNYNEDLGLYLRWDYYKEIGTPAINNTDDLVNVLVQMQKKHPTTPDGKKTYGVSMWQDWGIWNYVYPFFWLTGDSTDVSDIMSNPQGTMDYRDILTDTNSSYWKAMDFYYKANKAGVLDPDALTMKFDDYKAKVVSGQLLSGSSIWFLGDYNGAHAKDNQGFMPIPNGGGYSYAGGAGGVGWTDKCFAISKSCKTPDRAMDFINYVYSYDGARTMFSGVKGKDWDMVDGKPVINDATYKLQAAGGEDWNKTGIGLDPNIIGLSSKTIDPADGAPLSLFESPDAYAKRMNPLEKDYSDFYKVQYPYEIIQQSVTAGKTKNYDSVIAGLSEQQLIQQTTVVRPNAPDDLKKVEAKLKDLAAKDAVKMILSKDDKEFEANKTKALADFKAAGADKFNEFFISTWEANKKAAGVN